MKPSEPTGKWSTISCPAKLNLFLEVGSRRGDGYHELTTVMAPIRLADRLSLRSRSDGQIHLEVRCGTGMSCAGLPTESENLVYRILEHFRLATGCRAGADVILEKQVPLQAGLGGASSDAAAALKLAKRVWGVECSGEKLSSLAAELGSDIPFFLADGWAVCRGRGELVTKLSRGLAGGVVLVQPPVGFSTAEIYRLHVPSSEICSAAALIGAVEAGNWGQTARLLFNRLESAARRVSPWVERISQEFERSPAVGHQMTGSGSCYFGMFPNVPVARRSARRLKAALPECRVIVSDLLPAVPF